jgi:nitroreductase
MIQQIQERRSHFLKEFNGKKAPNTLIETLIHASIWAPSHKLTLPFRFVVISPDKLQELTSHIIVSYRENNLESLNLQKIEKMESYPEKLSHAIAIILKPSHKIPLWEEYATLGAAIQNMYLMIQEEPHFGAYWTTGNETNSEKMRSLLRVSPEEIHCGYFFIGGIDVKRTKSTRPNPDMRWL